MRKVTRASMLAAGLAAALAGPGAATATTAVPADVQAVGAAPAPVPPEAIAPHPDFSAALKAGGHESRTARVRVFSVKLRNVSGWTTTSVRACVTVSGATARITGVKAPGSRKQAGVDPV